MAVIAVVLFHLGIPLISGGFVGVDIFFVISGFLITSILNDDISNQQFSLLKFWERRIRRIAPALFLVVLSSLFVGWFLFLPDDFQRLSQQIFSVSTFSSNILFFLQSGYFDADNETKPLLHTWSLSVEEQFYFLFPLTLFFITKYTPRNFREILIGLCVLSMGLSFYGVSAFPTATFYLLPTRAWEMLLGALIVFIPSEEHLKRNIRWLTHTIAPILLAASIFQYQNNTPFPGLAALVPCLGAALLIWQGKSSPSVSHKFLMLKPLVFLGKISYSMYLWHWPIIVFYKYTYGSDLLPLDITIIFLSTILISFLSWKYVETPFRASGGVIPIPTASVVKLWAIFTFALIAIGLSGHLNNGYRDYYIGNRLTQDEAAAYHLVQISTDYDLYKHMIDNQDCIFWSREINQTFSDRFEKCSKKYGPAIIILGDSHAMNLFNISGQSSSSPFIVGVSQGGCRVHNNKKQCHYDGFLEFQKSHKRNIKLIIYHQSGSYFVQDKKGNVDSPLAFENGQSYKVLDHDIESVFDYVARSNQIVRTVWAGPFVESRIDFRDINAIIHKQEINPRSLEIFSALDAHIRDINNMREESKRVGYISLVDIFHLDKSFFRQGNCITYHDTDHFSSCGESLLAPMMLPIIKELTE